MREILLAAALVTAPSVSNPAVYTAIGLGTAFGSTAASLADNGQDIDIALNAAGIASVQTVGLPQYVLGGTVDSLTSAFGVAEFVFGHTDPLDALPGSPYTRQLIVTMTPEPGTGALVALGLIGVAAARRRRFRNVLGGAAVVALVAAMAPGTARGRADDRDQGALQPRRSDLGRRRAGRGGAGAAAGHRDHGGCCERDEQLLGRRRRSLSRPDQRIVSWHHAPHRDAARLERRVDRDREPSDRGPGIQRPAPPALGLHHHAPASASRPTRIAMPRRSSTTSTCRPPAAATSPTT